ncbi:pentapeptide repeat-containing protein [Lentzea sp. NPDC006480]|uniref:pentapeptide repeat-containing protein n=1 Tax=Lentzea sp. NPDC006480 TaxID=3157176 RepID=UPI0033AF1B39
MRSWFRPPSSYGEQLPWLVPALGLVVLMTLAGIAAWQAWAWLDRYVTELARAGKPFDGKDFVTAKLDAVKIALSIAAGGGALFALYLGVRRQRTAERDLRARLDAQAHTELDAANRQVTEQYTKAVEHLGADKAPVRLGGLYALERLAQDNEGHRQTVVNVICAYLRMPYDSLEPPPGKDSRARRSGKDGDPMNRPTAELKNNSLSRELAEERQVRIAAQDILVSHLWPDVDVQGAPVNPKFWREIDLDFSGAVLIGLDLYRCRIDRATFNDVKFVGSTGFQKAEFGGAGFHRAEFHDDAHFDGVEFVRGAYFNKADFAGRAGFRNAQFGSVADFDETRFGGDAVFSGVKFRGAAKFDKVDFSGTTDFVEAEFSEGPPQVVSGILGEE